jgi:hypothetical protein
MRQRLLFVFVGTLAIAGAIALVRPHPVAGQGLRLQRNYPIGAELGPVPKMSWGEPDLEGIWAPDFQVPLARPDRFKGKEMFTDEEILALDKERGAILRRDFRDQRGSEADVGGAYNSFFQSVRHSGRRTSLIIDPPDGKVPALTAEQQKRNAVMRDFRVMLLAATAACKEKRPNCAGGTYSPTRSPHYDDSFPYYNTANMNRANNPEDRSLMERCMSAVIPDFSLGQSWGLRQIVQAPGQISMFYDVGQGQGWQRVIAVDGSTHLPADIRQWHGDSRGHWERNTLVIDVTNFSPQAEFMGSRENLHLVERWTRVDADTIDYVVTIEDPTVWVRPWTARQELNRQGDKANRTYKEPRCHDGNFGMIGMLAGPREQEHAFAEGRGPDPATTGGGGGALADGDENRDILQ